MALMKYIQSTINFKFSFIRRSFGSQAFRLLDVGSGNHTASRLHRIFPNCEYYGLDITRDYNTDDKDFKVMKDFYELDLTRLQYDIIPDDYFDGIWMSHVIEHLHNGDEVILKLISKLRKGGYFYLEYPGKRSTKLPSMYGSLNFYDDPSHVRIYSVAELVKVFSKANCKVLKSGTRRNWFYIFGMPIQIFRSVLTRKRLQGNVFWDLLGFAEFLYVKKV